MTKIAVNSKYVTLTSDKEFSIQKGISAPETYQAGVYAMLVPEGDVYVDDWVSVQPKNLDIIRQYDDSYGTASGDSTPIAEELIDNTTGAIDTFLSDDSTGQSSNAHLVNAFMQLVFDCEFKLDPLAEPLLLSASNYAFLIKDTLNGSEGYARAVARLGVATENEYIKTVSSRFDLQVADPFETTSTGKVINLYEPSVTLHMKMRPQPLGMYVMPYYLIIRGTVKTGLNNTVKQYYAITDFSLGYMNVDYGKVYLDGTLVTDDMYNRKNLLRLVKLY